MSRQELANVIDALAIEIEAAIVNAGRYEEPESNGPVEVRLVPVVPLNPDAMPALGGLLLQLRHLLTAEIPVDDAARERTRLIMVHDRIADFIGRAWADRGGRILVQNYLLRIISAIQRPNEGARHPLWEPIKKGRGRKEDRLEILRARAKVSLSLYCFSHSGLPEEKAAKDFSKKRDLQSLKRLMRKGEDGKLSDHMLSWHKRFEEGAAPSEAQQDWQHCRELIDQEANGDQKKYRRLALHYMAMALIEAEAIVL